MATKTQLTEENNRLLRICNSREEEIRDLKKALVSAQENFSQERFNTREWRERALRAEGYVERIRDEDNLRLGLKNKHDAEMEALARTRAQRRVIGKEQLG